MTTDHWSEISKFNLLSIIIKIPIPARIRWLAWQFDTLPLWRIRTQLKAPALKCLMHVSNACLMHTHTAMAEIIEQLGFFW